MLFVNISSDRIQLQSAHIDVELPYQNLERTLPTALHEAYSQFPEFEIWVLNGPGGFTSLRIGCLVLNTLQMLIEEDIKFYSINKLDFFAYLIEQWFLPGEGLVTIGQKKNAWRYRHADISTEMVSMIEEIPESYFIDWVEEHLLLDQLRKENMLSWKFDGEAMKVIYQDQSILLTCQQLWLESSNYLLPKYMIDPTIGKG